MNSQVICECPICFDVIGDTNNITTECGHKFHASCLMTNVSCNGFSCPCCRTAMATVDSACESDSESESESESESDYDSESIGSHTTEESYIDDSIDYETNRSNNNILRGLRFFTNRVENISNDEEDERDELCEDEISRLPTVTRIGNSIFESGISIYDIVGAVMSIHTDYQINNHMFESYGKIWKKINTIIITEVKKTHLDEREIHLSQQESTSEGFQQDVLFTTVPSVIHKCIPTKQTMNFTTIDQIREDLKMNYPTH